jgi:hypothetical protein
VADDLLAFGAPKEFIDAAQEREEDGYFEVWEENYEAVMMFQRLQTQWNVIQGGFVGLNYPSVSVLFKIYKVDDEAEMMDDIIAMEHAALQVLNKREG